MKDTTHNLDVAELGYLSDHKRQQQPIVTVAAKRWRCRLHILSHLQDMHINILSLSIKSETYLSRIIKTLCTFPVTEKENQHGLDVLHC